MPNDEPRPGAIPARLDQQQLSVIDARIAAVEETFERVGGVTSTDTLDLIATVRVLRAAIEQSERARVALRDALEKVQYDEFSNRVLPESTDLFDQDRCEFCDACRYQGHAQGCRLSAAPASGEPEGE